MATICTCQSQVKKLVCGCLSWKLTVFPRKIKCRWLFIFKESTTYKTKWHLNWKIKDIVGLLFHQHIPKISCNLLRFDDCSMKHKCIWQIVRCTFNLDKRSTHLNSPLNWHLDFLFEPYFKSWQNRSTKNCKEPCIDFKIRKTILVIQIASRF